MRKFFLFLSAFAITTHCYTQNHRTSRFYPEDELLRQVNAAKDPTSKFNALINLRAKYTDRQRRDSCLKKIIQVAEESRDKQLIANAYVYKLYSSFNYTRSADLQTLTQSANDLVTMGQQENLDYAKINGYMYLSWIGSKKGEMFQAFSYASKALSLANELKMDSLTAECNAIFAIIYYEHNDLLMAYRYQMKALEIAEQLNNEYLLTDYYTWMADIYNKLKDYEKSLDYRFKVQNLYSKKGKVYDLLYAYLLIQNGYVGAKNYDMAQQFNDKAYMLADSLKLKDAKRTIKFNYIGVLNQKDLKISYEYLKSTPGLWDEYLSVMQPLSRHLFLSRVYLANDQLDSARFYIEKVVKDEYATLADPLKMSLHLTHAAVLSASGSKSSAASEYQQALRLAEKTVDVESQKRILEKLSELNHEIGDYKFSLEYRNRFIHLKDSLDKMNSENELVLMELADDQKRKEKLLTAQQSETDRRHNLQYMGMTVGIVTVFIFLIMLGLLSVSQRSIKILGFFAFIFLFEFIILLADKQIHVWTHGEPWKILMIKIALIAILLPLHHYVESAVIRYLTSKKLLEMRKEGFFKRWFARNGHRPVEVAAE